MNHVDCVSKVRRALRSGTTAVAAVATAAGTLGAAAVAALMLLVLGGCSDMLVLFGVGGASGSGGVPLADNPVADTTFGGGAGWEYLYGASPRSIEFGADGSIFTLSCYSDISPTCYIEKFSADGVLDTTYGTAGRFSPNVVAPYPDGSLSGSYLQSIGVADDGSVYAFGGVYYTTQPYKPVIVKLTPAGQLDTAFLGDGYFSAADYDATTATTMSTPPDSYAAFSFRNVVRVDGGFLITGTRNGPTIWKMADDGTFAAAFNGQLGLNGNTAVGGSAVAGAYNSIAVLSDGSLMLTGSADLCDSAGENCQQHAILDRIAADGTGVAGFGSGGRMQSAGVPKSAPDYKQQSYGNFAVAADGRIYASRQITTGTGYGEQTFEFFADRITAEGNMDTTFATNGTVVFNDARTTIQGVDIRGLYVYTLTPEGYAAIQRYTTAGVLDGNFGTAGSLLPFGSVAGRIQTSRLRNGTLVLIGARSSRGVMYRFR